MEKIFGLILKIPIELFLYILCCLLIILSFYDITYDSSLIVKKSSDVNIFFFVVGFIFLVLSIYSKMSLSKKKNKNISETENTICLKVDSRKIRVNYGRIEEISKDNPEAMVILPANEYFDDECIRDKKSALGAYINMNSDNIAEIETIISDKLKDYKHQEVEKETNIVSKSYGIGTTIFLKHLPRHEQPVLFTSVTTKRPNEGLYSELAFIFKAINRVVCVAADKRIDHVIIPIIGSGHGGVKEETAFVGILMSILGSIKRLQGHSIKTFEIVIYKKDKDFKPLLEKKTVKSILSFYSKTFI